METPLIIFLALLSLFSPAETERERVIREYNEIYLPSLISKEEVGWTGSKSSCHPGRINEEVYEKSLVQINYFRQLVGAPPIEGFDEEKNKKCQYAALLTTARGRLSHHPSKIGRCYSEEAAKAASKSNMGWGPNIEQYIHDWGSGNEAVGHRRWVLNPRATNFGLGLTDVTNVLWVVGKGRDLPEGFEFQSYPAEGCFPKPLVYPRWSISVEGADFRGARVRMKLQNGRSIPLQLLEPMTYRALNTLVWEPNMEKIDLDSDQDVLVKVEVYGVMVDGQKRSYRYMCKLVSTEISG